MKTICVHPFALLVFTSLTTVLLATGCASLDDSGSGSFASVVIKNHSEEEIVGATSNVFGAEGYTGGSSGKGKMLFEKPASRGTSFAREGIVAAGYGAQTINRVRVEIVALADKSYRLECKAFMVTGGSDPFFQNEVPLAHARSGPYQSLLDKVKKQLQ